MATALAAATDTDGAAFGRDWLEAGNVVPAGYTRDTIDEALALQRDTAVVQAAIAPGNGSGVTAPDTVPFCLWVCAFRRTDFVDAMRDTVSALGDRDTTCAIVGGILGGRYAPPKAWVDAREPLPDPPP